MSSIQSKVTAQGQISVPAEVRRQPGVGPGSVLVWEWRAGEDDGSFEPYRGAATTTDAGGRELP
jgi:bifunctional DNA-binding transcriptional regulator/antitoxin component of YhaV-PrlF toxin-antitoxin module